MSGSFDVSDKAAGLKLLEDITSNVRQTQDNVLGEILSRSANTEYLRRFLDGRSDKHLFKKYVPVVKYEDVKPYIDRIANGEPSDVLSGRPITGFFLSSGTSGGGQKMIPSNNKNLDNYSFILNLCSIIMSKYLDSVEQGKAMVFFFTKEGLKTPSGLLAMAGTSRYFTSDYFKNRPSNWYYSHTSPDEVVLCTDNKQSLYCHLLCGLVQRDHVSMVGSGYAFVFFRAIKLLEDSWREFCSNICSGQLSDWITDVHCTDSVSLILGGPNPELADKIRQECGQESWKGIITRLWPKAKCIQTVITGAMAQYVPMLEFYGRCILHFYAQYVIFRVFGDENGASDHKLNKTEDQLLDLADVKVGCCYEPVVTNFSGLYRIRVGDVLQVTGFYNNTPQFKFIRRDNAVLSIGLEKTSEEDLLNAVSNAKILLESSDLMLMDFTSYADVCSIPGHYVLYWELKPKSKVGIPKIDPWILEECCFIVEESLDVRYKISRIKEGTVGALEITIVQEGTFNALMDFFISQGSSINQYKTPTCIKSTRALEILENKVVARFFNQKDLE